MIELQLTRVSVPLRGLDASTATPMAPSIVAWLSVSEPLTTSAPRFPWPPWSLSIPGPSLASMRPRLVTRSVWPRSHAPAITPSMVPKFCSETRRPSPTPSPPGVLDHRPAVAVRAIADLRREGRVILESRGHASPKVRSQTTSRPIAAAWTRADHRAGVFIRPVDDGDAGIARDWTTPAIPPVITPRFVQVIHHRGTRRPPRMKR